jgi:protein ImuA
MTRYPPITNRIRLVERLRERVSRLECPGQPSVAGDGSAVTSSGIAALDRLLIAGGFRPGELIEWLQEGPGGGAEALSLLAAAAVCRDDGVLVVVDRRRTFYPPAAVALGVPLSRTIVVRVDTPCDEHWAFRQALGCRAVRAVWGRVERLDGRAMRRLQLAAERSGGVAMLVRPGSVRGQPTWAHTQLSVRPLSGQARAGQTQAGREGSSQRSLGFRVELVRCRGGGSVGVGAEGSGSGSGSGAFVDLELNMTDGVWRDVGKEHKTSGRHLAAELAGAATPRRSSRA